MKENISLYHFFAWSNHYGWQHLGHSDGYDSYDECYKENKFYINKPREKWKIMKLVQVPLKLSKT